MGKPERIVGENPQRKPSNVDKEQAGKRNDTQESRETKDHLLIGLQDWLLVCRL